jgi:hypothetical protein
MCRPCTYLISPTHNVEGREPEDFAKVLARCLADLAAGCATLEDCLQRYPAKAGRLAAILPFAEQARVGSQSDRLLTASLPVSPLKP